MHYTALGVVQSRHVTRHTSYAIHPENGTIFLLNEDRVKKPIPYTKLIIYTKDGRLMENISNKDDEEGSSQSFFSIFLTNLRTQMLTFSKKSVLIAHFLR